MYLPSAFEVTDIAALHDLIDEHPLGALVMHSRTGLDANHLPFLVDREPAPYGRLHAHVARANPLWRCGDDSGEVLVIFQGPSAYVTPSWYATKRETGKVVPTYNYAVVHAYGRLRAIDDKVALRALLERLTNRHEAARDAPWQVSDAPDDYIDRTLDGIVGIEIALTRLVGKWKVSQNRGAADRQGVARGLRASGTPEHQAMAELVDRHGRTKL